MEDKEKQIEEILNIAKIIDKKCDYVKCKNCNVLDNYTDEQLKGFYCSEIRIAEYLYNAGYRKLPEDSVVLTREEFWELSNKFSKKELDDISQFRVNKARKETAEKILKEIFALINNAKDKSSKIFGNSSDYGKGYKNSVNHFNEHILELAKQYGVETKG